MWKAGRFDLLAWLAWILLSSADKPVEWTVSRYDASLAIVAKQEQASAYVSKCYFLIDKTLELTFVVKLVLYDFCKGRWKSANLLVSLVWILLC